MTSHWAVISMTTLMSWFQIYFLKVNWLYLTFCHQLYVLPQRTLLTERSTNLSVFRNAFSVLVCNSTLSEVYLYPLSTDVVTIICRLCLCTLRWSYLLYTLYMGWVRVRQATYNDVKVINNYMPRRILWGRTRVHVHLALWKLNRWFRSTTPRFWSECANNSATDINYVNERI